MNDPDLVDGYVVKGMSFLHLVFTLGLVALITETDCGENHNFLSL